MLKIAIWALFFANLLCENQAFAYPEMVRYGYVNCNSCHVSLTGAGVLNDYGREIAREKLALFKSDDENAKEQQFAYGALSDTTIAKYLKMGGDVRAVYYYLNNDQFTEAQTIFMQGDLEAAFVKGKWTLDGTAGIEQPIPGQNVSFISRRHYVQYAISDAFNVRAGKYSPAFGIKNPEHIFITRDPLQFGDTHESYNLEFSYLTEQWNIFLTGVFGRFDDQEGTQDRGATAQVAYAPTEKLKFGVNAWYGSQITGPNRWVLGAFGMLGFTSKIYFGSEVDFQLRAPNDTSPHTDGVATTQKLSYEVLEGFWTALIQEYGKSDFSMIPSQAENYGIELQVFPRSHFEFDLAYERCRDGGGNQDFYDYFWLVSHYYF
jgi:hypothetical protein